MIFEDYMQKMRDVGKKARERDVSTPFHEQANLHQRNWLEARESAENRAAKASLAQAGQEYDSGVFLGGKKAGDEIYRRDIRQGQLQADQASAGAMVNLSQAEEARNRFADASDIQAAQAGAQYEAQVEAQERAAELQREMAQIQAASRALDRQHAQAMNDANNATQRAGIAAQTANARAQIQVAEMRIKADIRRTQMQNPQFGGGTMTASYSSGAGNFKDHLKSMGVMR